MQTLPRAHILPIYGLQGGMHISCLPYAEMQPRQLRQNKHK
jgi:hypothetical protein